MRAAILPKARSAATKARLVAVESRLQALAAQEPNASVKSILLRAIKSLHYPVKRYPEVRNKAAKRASDRKAAARIKEVNEAIKGRAGNKSQRWTGRHDEVVMKAVATDAEIAIQLGRSLLAIKARRKALYRRAKA